ncbi:hypothetical protein N9M92_02245 [Flavobacteriaceae bacterium]|nr:hypothetical protein [Flavobacteriaceae bacterium]
MINFEERQFLEKNKAYTIPPVSGQEVEIDGETFYKISNVDAMRPFFMSLVSNSNHWLFISSIGGLTAGRKDSSNALFPYYTDDKIIYSSENTGSKSIFWVTKHESTYLWEPFSIRQKGHYNTTRNLYKNTLGNKIIFEEINHDLNLNFSYSWKTSDRYGFVRQAELQNQSMDSTKISLIDGLQNLLPWGIEVNLQMGSSNLADAYKKNELDQDSGLGIYSLSALIVDKAEPSEALKANTVWSLGFENPKYLLSSLQLDYFRMGKVLKNEWDVRAEKGAYFLNDDFQLGPKSTKNWTIVADVNQSINQITEIREQLINNENLIEKLHHDINLGSDELIRLVAAADGLQLTADGPKNTRHFSNTLFNIMRGGIFDLNYTIEKGDFSQYLEAANKKLFQKKSSVLNQLDEQFHLSALHDLLEGDGDPDFIRLAKEYLPLKFSRRHGDPSRPWNKFSINTKSEVDGSKILDYQGNWRDIFQNWEALAHSYPNFIEGMIYKFLNASTFEGYNPYRLTKDGFDWETIEPDNPWSYIGYWGDHQIIYLLKFLEFSEDYFPNKLNGILEQDLFVFANVPYKIKAVEEILKDSKNTIDFDLEAHQRIQNTKNKIGSDGALLQDAKGQIYRVNFIEKILITLLAKISNFIPGGGIWMNTQRPEWNDANNALVGNGVSMVTLYYLRRFLSFFKALISQSDPTSFDISTELYQFFSRSLQTFEQYESLLNSRINDQDRKAIFMGLGTAGSDYREAIYKHGHTAEKVKISTVELKAFIKIAQAFVDHTINGNIREDKLYHSYNLVSIEEDRFTISNFPEMLEGQVAVLSSGILSTHESVELLDSLRKSKLYREDQNSYILYPDKDLPLFLEKNLIPSHRVSQSTLIQKLIKANNVDIISKDVLGQYHFNAAFNNVNGLKKALKCLPKEYQSLVSKESQELFSLYESVFNHKSFTGRSGTFFGYEGLGSIYWHMVSKLLLANFEAITKVIESGVEKKWIDSLAIHFHEINAGIGVHKSPQLYGAFPTDPYSHTPKGKGAQQPGMTGQVKEDLLSRAGELGVKVRQGTLCFEPVLLRSQEFLEQAQVFSYVDIHQNKNEIQLAKNSLAFTVCQVPVFYQKSDENLIEAHSKEGSITHLKGNQLDLKISQSLFSRSGEYVKIIVFIDPVNFLSRST